MRTYARTIRYAVEYALLRTAAGLAGGLPLPMAGRLVTGVADLLFAVGGSRRRTAVDNILKAGIRDDGDAATSLARASFRHLGIAALEAFRMSDSFHGDAWRRHVHISLPPALVADLECRERGIVLASGHFGNWELGGRIASTFRPLTAIARPMDNPWVDRYVNRSRFDDRLRRLAKHSPRPRDLLRILEEHGGLGIVMDQHAGRKGMIIEFLGRPASAHTSAARLAMAAGVPLWFAYCRRTGPMTYDCRAAGPIDCTPGDDRDAVLRRITTDLHNALAIAIREAPEQYMWAHRRWRVSTCSRGDEGRRANS